MKKPFPLLLVLCLLIFPRFSSGQLAPAAVVITQGAPGEHFLIRSEGAFPFSSAFAYVNYSSGEIDAITPTVQPSGTFSGISDITGRTLSGSITTSMVTFTYNGSTRTVPIASSYGETRSFAGVWLGGVVDSVFGAGFGETVITSQGKVFVLALQDFAFSAGFGTIDSAGRLSVPLLNGNTITGTFPSPTYGRVTGTFKVSTGSIETATLVRAAPSRLLNISTRGFVGTGDQVLIAGFIVGSGGKVVLIDAKGPSLAAQGVANPLNATKIDLYSGSQIIASNNGWRNASNFSEIQASGIAPTNDRESAIQVALEPGAYTAVVSSGDGSAGIALVEVFGVGDTEGP